MKKSAIAIIQARMSSSRLPGKVLKPLAGKAMIWHIYQRALQCKFVDKVIIATSKEESDDPLDAFCNVEMDMPEELCVNRYRLTIDEENDYQLIKNLYENLYQSEPIDLSDALRWLDNHPDVANVNKNVFHKRLNVELEEKRSQWAAIPKAGVYRWSEL